MYDSNKNSGFIDDMPTENIAYRWSNISLLHSSANGYSEVYRAKRYGKWHVLKCLTKVAANDTRYRNLLEKEFAIAIELIHPNIVKTIGIEEVEGLGRCIIQEYIDGTTWAEYFKESQQANDRNVVVQLVEELCLAIDYLHQRQITHRDIKPNNIMITHG